MKCCSCPSHRERRESCSKVLETNGVSCVTIHWIVIKPVFLKKKDEKQSIDGIVLSAIQRVLSFESRFFLVGGVSVRNVSYLANIP